jgi:hypothetical protein
MTTNSLNSSAEVINKIGLDARAFKGAPKRKESTINRILDDAAAYGKPTAKGHWSFRSATLRKNDAIIQAQGEAFKAQRLAAEEARKAHKRKVLAKMAADAKKFNTDSEPEVVENKQVTTEIKGEVAKSKATKSKASKVDKASKVSVTMAQTLEKIARREAIQAAIAAKSKAAGTKVASH